MESLIANNLISCDPIPTMIEPFEQARFQLSNTLFGEYIARVVVELFSKNVKTQPEMALRTSKLSCFWELTMHI